MNRQIALILAVLIPLAVEAKSPPRYRMTLLGVLPGGTNSFGSKVNNRGEVLGHSQTAGGHFGVVQTSFIYSNGFVRVLGGLQGWPWSFAYDINDSGQVTGDVEGTVFSSSIHRSPPGFYFGTPHDINNSGVVCGGILAFNAIHAFVFSNNTYTMLPRLFARPLLDAEALAINNHGIAVGYSDDEFQRQQAVQFEPTGVVRLGALPGDNSSSAICINDRGHIAGRSDFIDHRGFARRRGFLLRNGQMHDLGSLVGYPDVFVHAMNEFDQIVGLVSERESPSIEETTKPFVYIGGRLYDLNSRTVGSREWRVVNITDINDAGWIVGTASRDGVSQAVLLKPIPRLARAEDKPSKAKPFTSHGK